MVSSTILSLAYSNSMVTNALICTVISIVIAMVLRGLRRRFVLLPPGPWFLQFQMFYYTMRMKLPCRIEKIYEAQTKKYGKLFSFSIGLDTHVVISDPDIIREAFIKQRATFNDRRCPSAYAMSFGGEQSHRILFGNGRLWKTTRRVVSPCLKNVGTWGQKMESIILQQADYLTEKLAEFDSKPFDPRHLITKAVANIIHTMVHGYTLDYDDPRLQQMIDSFLIITGHSLVTSGRSLRYLPFLYYLPKTRPLRQAYTLLKIMLSTAVNTQADEYDHNNINTIIKRVLQAAEEDDGVGEDSLKTKEVWRIVYDLMLAGSDTTANTLKWAVLLMAYYPDIQMKVHEEIDSVLGDRSPCLKDKTSMPYIQATSMEVLRVRPVVPLALPHVTSKTTVLRGYTIPKGAILIPNIWSCHHNPEYWVNPEEFNPSRFLSADGQSLGEEPQTFMPFSCGPRKCVGDQLAKNELFLIFTKIMQRFDIDFAPGDRPESFDEGCDKGLILRPNNLNVRLLPRKIHGHEE